MAKTEKGHGNEIFD